MVESGILCSFSYFDMVVWLTPTFCANARSEREADFLACAIRFPIIVAPLFTIILKFYFFVNFFEKIIENQVCENICI